jgi:hypothetical protein
MSQLKVDTITDEAGTGSPSFPNGVSAAELTGDVAAARITNALNATGSAPVYTCRAWVNFSSTNNTVAIRASGNVSSITRVAAGLYTINFAAAMPDANYSVVGTSESVSGSVGFSSVFTVSGLSSNWTVNSFRVVTKLSNSQTASDSLYNTVSVFR